ncbi:hypothetical protein Esti_001924 [Eimeria stiedai]
MGGSEASSETPAEAAASAPGDAMEYQPEKPSSSSPKDMSSGSHASEETVRLISSEGKPLDVPLHVAKECELLARMLAGNFSESRTHELSLPNIRHRTLCKIVDYLKRRCQWREGGGAPLEFEVDDDAALDLLIAADFLGMNEEERDLKPEERPEMRRLQKDDKIEGYEEH